MYVLAESIRLLIIVYVLWIFGILPFTVFIHKPAPCFADTAFDVPGTQRFLALVVLFGVFLQSIVELVWVCLNGRVVKRVQRLKYVYYHIGILFTFFLVWHGTIAWVAFRQSPCFTTTLGDIITIPGPLTIPSIPPLPSIPNLPDNIPRPVPDIGKIPEGYVNNSPNPEIIPETPEDVPDRINDNIVTPSLGGRPRRARGHTRGRTKKRAVDIDFNPQDRPLEAIADNAEDVLSDLRPDPVVRNTIEIFLQTPLLRITYGTGMMLHVIVGGAGLLFFIGRMCAHSFHPYD